MTEPLPAGTAAIVDQAIEEGAQTLFSAADVPVARAAELLAALQGPAVRSVLEMRVEQMVKHGHTLDGDLDLPIRWLPNDARVRLQAAGDALDGAQRNLPLARSRIVKALAIGLAAIDVLDATITAEAA